MEIQKGIVKYKDRSDIVCTYCITDDGRKYYFLDPNDENKFSNESRIASTALIEAVDPMVKASNIGLLDKDGKEIIPFNNRSIRPINNETILVELANPVSASVIEANKLKSNPLAATKLVSTPALIKDKMSQKMGNNGRYIFNDQFSEATIYDINGNNLVDNQYYSFVGLSGEKLYFSKNTAESDIVEYSILPPETQNSNSDEMNSNLDINNVVVDQNVVEKAFDSVVNNEELPKEEVEGNTDVVENETVPVSPVASEEVVPNAIGGVPFDSVVSQEFSANPIDAESSMNSFENVPADEVNEEVDLPLAETEEVKEEVPAGEKVASEAEVDLPFAETEEEKEKVPAEEEVASEAEVDLPFAEAEEEKEEVPAEEKVTSEEEVELPFDIQDDGNEEEIEEEDSDLIVNNESEEVALPYVDEDVNEDYNGFDADKFKVDERFVENDNTMEDFVKSFTELMNQNKEQRNEILQKDATIIRLKTSISKLSSSRKELLDDINSLQSANHELENKIRNMEKSYDQLSHEAELLREKATRDNGDIARLLANAKALLGENNYANEEEEESYHRRVA